MQWFQVKSAEQIERVKAYLSEVCPETSQTVTVKPYKPPPAKDHRAKMEAMITELAPQAGYHREEYRRICKEAFGPVDIIEMPNGKIITPPKSVSDYSRAEVNVVIDALYQEAAENNWGLSQ